ncbi:MAG: TIGR04283 family arsenosugar biosynthesis glycosyltransferase [Parvularculaceae bacterium]
MSLDANRAEEAAAARAGSQPVSISVIIPALNAAPALAPTLAALDEARSEGTVAEIIVAEGGSSDATAEIAEGAGARVIPAPRGRGTQLRAGAAVARAPWLLFLHADTAPGAGWAAAARAFATDADNRDRAAYFRFRLDDAAFGARIVEAGVRLRNAAFKMPYGDQGLLISKRFYDALGGYAPIPLMEDVDLVRRILRAGGRRALVALDAEAVTSAARYRRDGYARRVLRNARTLAAYFSGASPERLAREYERSRSE